METKEKNATPEMECKDFSQETKDAYAEAFLTKFSVGNKKVIQCTEALSEHLKRIVNAIGYGKATVGSYVQSILDYHLEGYKKEILELRALSLLSTPDPKEIDSLSLNAKKYQALFLTGDGVNRTRKGIYVNRDIVDKLHKIILDVNGEKPTVGSYAEAIIRDHIESCSDIIADMTNDQYMSGV